MTSERDGARDPLAGISSEEQRIMERLLRTHPEQQKSAQKLNSTRAMAQRRRRERERDRPSRTSCEV